MGLWPSGESEFQWVDLKACSISPFDQEGAQYVPRMDEGSPLSCRLLLWAISFELPLTFQGSPGGGLYLAQAKSVTGRKVMFLGQRNLGTQGWEL